MAFNVADFRSEIMRDDVLRNNKFRVRIPAPMGMFRANQGVDLRVASELEAWAETASIPNIGIQTNKVYRYGYGVVENRPYSKLFTDVTVGFIADGFAEKWKFFENWTNMIFNTNMEGGINGASELVGVGFMGSGGSMGMDPYELSFREEYISDVIIDVFNNYGDMVLSVTLRDAFPVSITGLDLNWQDNNSYAKVQVTFAYTDIFRNVLI